VSRGFTRALQTEEVQNLKKEKPTLHRIISDLQSSDVSTASLHMDLPPGESVVETTKFLDAESGDVEAFEPSSDSTYTESYKADSTLAGFLSRPVLIDSRIWTEGAGLSTTIDPWTLYFTNSVIKNKLENYAYIRCNLHVKVMLNASPFYYGLLGFFYRPLPILDPAPIVTDASNRHFVSLSQRPHIWCYPSESQGGEMVLPFLNPRNWINLTSLSSMGDIGDLDIQSFTNLLNANSVVGSDCDVQVYAWAEDVYLCGPTYAAALQSSNTKKNPGGGSVSLKPAAKANPVKNTITSSKSSSSSAPKVGASNQMGTYMKAAKQRDSTSGTVSGPASAIARASGIAASAAAALGPFSGGATLAAAAPLAAVSTAAAGISAIAEVFGYTDTPVIDSVKPYKSLPFHGFSSAEISHPNDKLTLDPKNELAMCGTAVGAPDSDELNIEAFCRRESYLTTYNWAASDIPDALLMNARVTPDAYRYNTTGTGQHRIYYTPMGLLCRMFQYWKGDIVFRFRFICSKYHRGRVRITWDPATSVYGAAATNTSNYNRIIDIAAEPDVRIKIPYLQLLAYMRLRDDLATMEGDSGTEQAPLSGFDNGQLSIRVFTQQTSPVASADIKIVTSIYAEGMEFGGPREIINNFSHYALQSADVNTYSELSPAEPLFEETMLSPETNLIYMGEYISSLKQLMRRTCKSFTAYFPSNTTARDAILSCHISRMPLYNGYDPSGIHSADEVVAALQAPYNFVHNVPMNWIGQCFVACRGSVNWNFNMNNNNFVSTFKVQRDPTTLAVADYYKMTTTTNGTDLSTANSELWAITTPGIAGMALTNQMTQTGLSVVAPMYNSNRFYGCSPNQRTLGQTYDSSNEQGILVEAHTSPADGSKNSKYNRLDGYVAIGADFAYHFFLNVPTIFHLDTLPVGNDP
jgi:hypothetical protein